MKMNFKPGQSLIWMLDIDDTIVEFNFAIVNFLNNRFGTKVRFDHVIDYDLSKIFQKDRSEIDLAVMEFYFSKSHMNIQATPCVDLVIRTLMNGGHIEKIILVTSRPEIIRNVTMDLIKHRYPIGIFDQAELILLGHYIGDKETMAKARCKSEICRDYGVDVVVEDNSYHSSKIAADGRRVFLLNKPWNHQFDDKKFNQENPSGEIIRVDNWIGINNFINRESFLNSEMRQ